MNEVRFGIVGAGLWGQSHAKVYTTHPSARLAAVCDLDENRAAALASGYGAEKVYTRVADLAADPEVDAVAVVTPDFAHRDPLMAVLEAGKHVIVEKPLATTDDDLRAIAPAVRRAEESGGIKFMVDFHTRWSPPIVSARKDIRDGALGSISSAYYRLNDTMMVATDMLSWAAKSSILWFLGSHTVDTLRFLLDDEVERVYSVSREGVLKERGVDTIDLYQSILEFSSGPVATIENNWIIPNTCPKVNDIKVNILGSKGMYSMDLTNSQDVERYLEGGSSHPDYLVKTEVHGKPVGFAYESIRAFVDCVARDEPVLCGLEDGLRVSRVVLALMESARTRQPVTVGYD